MTTPSPGEQAPGCEMRGRALSTAWNTAIVLWLAVGIAACAGKVDRGPGQGPVDASAPVSTPDAAGVSRDGGGFSNSPSTVAAPTEPPRTGELPADCVGETQRAQRVDVDLYIMLDRSNSMLELTGTGASKWDAIRDAISGFVNDPASEGLGVGLQYFPLGAPGVPEQCQTDAECGEAAGPCMTRACLPPNNPFLPFEFLLCVDDFDCPPSSPGCASFGECSADPAFACFNLGANGCQARGDCNPVTSGCLRYASCDPIDYALPAVPIAVLSGNAVAIDASLASVQPIGLTPSAPALAGALRQARDHAEAEPSHRVVAVLATDGFPTDCLASGVLTVADAVAAVADVAAQGLGFAPSVETYVIGVFAPTDTDAKLHLDTMAAAGGTERAFLVDATGSVDQELRAALDAIRGGTLACEFQLPSAPEGRTLDYHLVNVELTDVAGTRALFYVGDEASCTTSELGWYYDADPERGGVPTKISACPAACDALQSASEASVSIRLGCESITIRPD